MRFKYMCVCALFYMTLLEITFILQWFSTANLGPNFSHFPLPNFTNFFSNLTCTFSPKIFCPPPPPKK